MPTYHVYLNHVDRAYAMYEQGTSRTLEWRGPYSDAYYETAPTGCRCPYDRDNGASAGHGL